MENIYNLVLDLKQKITQTEIVIPQLDNNTHKFNMKVTQNGDEYVLEDEITSELAILKTDGQFVVLPAQKMGSTYTATLTEQALTTAGITKAELRFKKSDELLASTQFSFLVREVIVSNKNIKSTTEYKALEGLINEAKSMQESLKKGESVLGDVNKIKEDLAVIKESILNKSKELNDKLASADEKINEINSCITKAETVLNSFENSQNKIDNLSNLLKELNKIQLTLDELNKSINNANTQKTELNTSIESAKTEKSNLDAKIAEGKQTATNLENKTSAANTTKSQLEQANTTASNAKQSLESATATANDARAKLDNSNRLGNTLSSDLSNKISQGGNLNSSLAASISSANNAKRDLDGSISNAESTNTSLTATDTEAKNTESLIRDLMSQLNLTKEEVQGIIASGNLDQYVTDPKLQETLKSYATKADLQGIDVTTYGLASQSSNGLMSAADKKRLDNIKEQVALTETQYNALSSAQQNDATKIYFIKA